MAEIAVRRDGGVLVVTVDNPPVNAFSHAMRAGLVDAIAVAAADETVRAVVVRGGGRVFSGGADITEFGKPPRAPSLPQVIDAVEECPKPVIAAIHGTAFGGGCELALGCAYRIAAPSALMGLPEVKLGLLPGAAIL